MNIRRFNYTKRERIHKEHIVIRLSQDHLGIPQFTASIDLSSYELPDDAKVYIEAYYKSSVMRFSFGAVSETSLYASKVNTFNDIKSTQYYFRVKVVDETEEMGRLIAVADKIDPITRDYDKIEKLPLLHVVQSDLGNRVWRLDLSPDLVMPTLEVNDTLEIDKNIKDVVRADEGFISLVFPQLIHEILFNILFMTDDVDEWDDTDWHAKWLQYAKKLTNQYTETNVIEELEPHDKYIWINQVVEYFCQTQGIAKYFQDYSKK